MTLQSAWTAKELGAIVERQISATGSPTAASARLASDNDTPETPNAYGFDDVLSVHPGWCRHPAVSVVYPSVVQ
jgi:hypothetical protein